MKEEIAATVFFITTLAKKHGKLDRRSREKFAVELTSVLFERYKSHWYPENPSKGQAFRCLRMNKSQCKDAVVDRACRQSHVDYEDLGLPTEMTIWVDPFNVSCRYGERSTPFCVAPLESQRDDGEFSRWINSAVEKAFLDYSSGSSSDEESVDASVNSSVSSGGGGSSDEHKSIPTVNNPNSVYQASEFALPVGQPWLHYPKRKPYLGDGYLQHQTLGYYSQNKPFKSYRPSFSISGPRVDRYHWVSKNRS